jgi:membrane associated rhomboid family serine protease
MLEDRHYMRQPGFRSPWAATVVLLVVNVAAFVLELVCYGPRLAIPSDDYFALNVEGLRHGHVWQLLTYQFMHGGWLHLLLNCWAIYVFGRAVEEALGRRSFLALYFSSGVIGGLFQALAMVLLGSRFETSVVGASAGAFGLIAAFASLYPERPLTILVYFIVPVTMRAKFLLLISALVALVGVALPRLLAWLGMGGNVAHAAHLGGMLTGIVFVRYAVHWHWHWPRFQQTRAQPPRLLVKAPHRASGLWGQRQDAADENLPPEEFLSKEVDPILDKISAHGIQSLTERERRILETAREKIVRR